MISRKLLYLLGVLTIIGMGGIGLLIAIKGHELSINSIIHGKTHWAIQMLIGSGFGAISGFAAWELIRSKFMIPVRTHYSEIFKATNMKLLDIFFISFCAGIGEELLFRVALQPYMGVLITSVVFVAIHGYLNPMNWRISVYGAYMTVVIACLGYLYENYGFITAMMAHAAIDIVLLKKLTEDPS